ncbi:single-stranded DNA-binding protein [Arthrobacter sp. ISL-28]|uniref:single-stranded DNA-binding protein n=1 Tax=Arthrobacter sp. ISL-28 TaxID=2819108 RepID=UPI001BE5C8A8|nr:single-stranded DNA-binding protein [Arthrobacter sp. ISL-28]MBT2523236.1 single-stranded DNA-binding protein [Arthrobacter sp. ISL-28]
MSGENSTSITGNLTADPQLRTVAGTAVANFTIASTPRIFDAQTKKWKDGETLFLRASVWRDMAENVAASLTKGSPVVASGRLKPRTYETKAGEKRTVIEFEIDEIGLSLRHSAAAPTGPQRSRNEPAEGVREEAGHPADHFTISPREFAEDDAWFGIHANPGGRVHIAGVTDAPAFQAGAQGNSKEQ